jgi:uncharacterized membrane protein YbhN (UPF0104 family)
MGLRVFHHAGRLFAFTLFTALIWVLDAMGTMVGARAFDIHLTFPVALLLLAGMGLGSALPATPGYVGIYQFVAVTILPPFGIDRTAALAMIIVGQVMGYAVVLVLGSLGLFLLRGAQRKHAKRIHHDGIARHPRV